MKKKRLPFRMALLRLSGGELHLNRCMNKGAILVKVSKAFSEKKARKWLWVALGVFVALQIYFVQEMIAALILFTGIFAVCAVVALALYLVDRGSRWGLAMAENQSKRALVAVEEISKKQLRRPRSEPAQ
jgi:uncharacterized membrane protein (UPF0136 family)